MKLDLRVIGDYKIIDGFVIQVNTRKVFNQNGTVMGVLPKKLERDPQSGPEILELLKPAPKEKKKKAEKPKAAKKRGISLASLKGEA